MRAARSRITRRRRRSGAASMPVLWKGRAGIFRRDVGDGEHAEVVIDGRVYRIRIEELC